jgi:nucleotide-binding universal stress UspA family protein
MRILLATDGSATSRKAAAALAKLHLQGGDTVHIVSVADSGLGIGSDLYGGYLPNLPDTEKTAAAACSQIVEEAIRMVQAVGEVNVTGEVLHGAAEARIVEAASSISADLVIVGSQGSNTFERLVLGSVSDRVVHHAHCSVLVVRANG